MERHDWTKEERVLVYSMIANQCRRANVTLGQMNGGNINYKPVIQETVKKIRALGCLQDASDEAIHCQITVCVLALRGIENNYGSKKQRQQYLDIHNSLQIIEL